MREPFAASLSISPWGRLTMHERSTSQLPDVCRMRKVAPTKGCRTSGRKTSMKYGKARAFDGCRDLIYYGGDARWPCTSEQPSQRRRRRQKRPRAGPGEVLWTRLMIFRNWRGRGQHPDPSDQSEWQRQSAYRWQRSRHLRHDLTVFDDDQEMGECCGCPISPAGIRNLLPLA